MSFVLLTAREQIASYVSALASIYTLVIFAYIVTNLVLSLGVRIPYSRYTDAVLGFLRDVTEPYLRIFRRILPPFGAFDFSPIIAIFVLQIVSRIVVNAIHG